MKTTVEELEEALDRVACFRGFTTKESYKTFSKDTLALFHAISELERYRQSDNAKEANPDK